ncbi:hypothetical protein E1B28_009013 [Marasmius oreades]|nr:uncharacterized protein E1B28_009013 [Marasmius oreades]KAG7092679.1 hypothetical protein E1B28_009013 [Marasmius oreades]
MGKLRAAINPWAILDKLKTDEKKLMISMQILGTAMIAIYSPTQSSKKRRAIPIDISSNADLRAFWMSEIGEQISYCSAEFLALALSRYLNVQTKAQAKDLLALRLDEYGAGCITLANFDAFVGGRPLMEAMMELGLVQVLPFAERSDLGTKSMLPDTNSITPILVLVDDNPENQLETLEHARALGVDRYVFKSTAAAKNWIEWNEDMLRQADQMNRLRIMSDNSRWEEDIDSCQKSPEPSMNLRAGETILRYLRGRQYRAPVLIYAGLSMPMTNYVLQYSNSGSTCYQEVVDSFLDGLLDPEKADDGWWRDYDVVPKGSVKPLLIWVDDDIGGHTFSLEYAKSLNIEIVPFVTTDAAKLWITSNEIILRRMEGAHLLRFISDNSRLEGPFYVGGPQQLNRGAGKQFLEFVRSNGYLSPFLIVCRNVGATRYVCDHENAGSTRDPQVLQNFLVFLAERRSNDNSWKGCGT